MLVMTGGSWLIWGLPSLSCFTRKPWRWPWFRRKTKISCKSFAFANILQWRIFYVETNEALVLSYEEERQMDLTPLKRALVSGGLSMTYKVHNPRATRRCETRQHSPPTPELNGGSTQQPGANLAGSNTKKKDKWA